MNYEDLDEDGGSLEEPLDSTDDEPPGDQSSDWDATDRRDWIVNGLICSVIIAVADGSLVSAAIWVGATLTRAYYGMPAIVRKARKLFDSHKKFYLGVLLGWALYPGPLVGSFGGAILPFIWNLPISSFQGALLGLIVGPITAAVVGIVFATIVLGVAWLITRQWPDLTE